MCVYVCVYMRTCVRACVCVLGSELGRGGGKPICAPPRLSETVAILRLKLKTVLVLALYLYFSRQRLLKLDRKVLFVLHLWTLL